MSYNGLSVHLYDILVNLVLSNVECLWNSRGNPRRKLPFSHPYRNGLMQAELIAKIFDVRSQNLMYLVGISRGLNSSVKANMFHGNQHTENSRTIEIKIRFVLFLFLCSFLRTDSRRFRTLSIFMYRKLVVNNGIKNCNETVVVVYI